MYIDPTDDEIQRPDTVREAERRGVRVTAPRTTTTGPVRVVPVGPDHVGRSVLIGGTASSRTAAIRAAREAGYRVVGHGGLVEYGPWGEDGPGEWTVTVRDE